MASDDFTAKTHAELARLTTEAKAARRLIGHPICRDEGACRHCADLRRIHALVDDHLEQLETPPVTQDAPREPVKMPPPARYCGICGRTRFRGFRGAVCCLACDGTQHGSEWVSLDLEAQE